MSNHLDFKYDDGGRELAGFKGHTGDCVLRSIVIATSRDYATTRLELMQAQKEFTQNYQGKKYRQKGNSVFRGLHRPVYEKYLEDLGWYWTPTMQIGSGCKVHLLRDELPNEMIIACVSKHLVAVDHGKIRDINNPSRNGKRCVYGYYRKATDSS